MFVRDKEMYHFYKSGTYDDEWEIGNIIDNSDDDFINDFWNHVYNMDSMIRIFGKDIPFNQVLEEYITGNNYRDYPGMLIRMADMMISNQNLLKRELALEDVRKKHFPNLVSRKQAIWLCDKIQIKYWQNSLPGKRVLYRVSFTGQMFVSSSELIPKGHLSYKEIMDEGFKYWNADNIKNYSLESLEYLAKGKIKILEKTK